MPRHIEPRYPPPVTPLGAVLSLLGRGVVAYHPSLVGVSGGVTPALMLSQALYWTRILAQQDADREGWFWKTRDQWTAETALSRFEQETARRRLTARPFWHQERRGMPARLWFRVDLEALARVIDDTSDGAWDWHDRARVLRLLGRPLVVYRSLASACRSVTAAILHSRLLHELRSLERRHALSNQTQGSRATGTWHLLSPTAVMTATGLSRAEFYHARRMLRAADYVHDRLEGVPPRALWRLDTDRLATDLGQLEDPSAEVADGSETPVVAQLAEIETDSWLESRHKNAESRTLDCGNPHSKNPESRQLKIRNPADLSAGIRTTSRRDSGFPYTGLTTVVKITSETTPPTPSDRVSAETAAAPPQPGGVGSSIIWPKGGLLPNERVLASSLLARIPDLAQVVIDELAGQMAKGIVREPLPYLRHLTEQACRGQFIPLVASRVAAQRDRVAKLAEVRQGPHPAPAAAPIRSLSELTPCQREARRTSLRQLRTGLSRHSGSTTSIPEPHSPTDEMNP